MSDPTPAVTQTASAPPPGANVGAGSGWLRLGGEFALVALLAIVTFWKALPASFHTPDYDWLALAKYGDGEIEFLKKTLTAYRWFAGDLFAGAYAMFGPESATPYRLILLIIHVTNAVLCGRLAARILARPAAGWIAASLFVLAPSGSEAVHSISAFVYPCITLLLLGGLLLYDQCIEKRSVVRWGLAFGCVGLAALLREHWVAALPLMILIELARAGGMRVLRTAGFWLRLGPVAVAGAVVLIVRHIVHGNAFIPAIPEYKSDVHMLSRLLVTFERLVLPPLPLDMSEYLHIHQAVGVFFIILIIFAVIKGSREDRWRAGAVVFMLFIALAPFLPVVGDHIRQRFAYFGTAFAATLAAYVICLAAERMSPRVTVPVSIALLAGLLMEQQAEFERYYTAASNETRVRMPSYKTAVAWVRQNDDIAFFVGDRQPNFTGISSMLRVVTGIERRQVLQVRVSSAEDFFIKYNEVCARTGSTGIHRIFVRGADGFDYIRLVDLHEAIHHVFATKPDGIAEFMIFAIVPRAILPGADSRRVVESRPASAPVNADSRRGPANRLDTVPPPDEPPPETGPASKPPGK